jgi:gas vesicle protein
MSEDNSSRSFLIGLALGAATGMAIAFLYAPQSGKETRTVIREKAAEARERARDIIEEAEEKARAIIAQARNKAAETKEAEN